METDNRGLQEHTIAMRTTAEYVGRRRARPTFREWWEELALTAPGWALVAVAGGALLVILAVAAAVVLS